MQVFFLLALVGFAAAATTKISVSNPGPFTLYKGFTTTITFSLNEPIICQDPAAYCAVVVLLTNPNTKAVSLNTCQVKWTRDTWYQPVTITVGATENFVDDGQHMYVITTGPAISASQYYANYDPVDITLNTMSRAPATCSATGDPHYTSFDGLYFHYYPSGQQVLAKSTSRRFEVQTRLYFNPNWHPALHCGIAVKENDDAVYVNRCPGDVVGIVINFNGPLATQPVITRSGGSYTFSFHSGASVHLDDGSLYYNVYVTVPGVDWNAMQGMCGNNNGDPNDDGLGQYVTETNQAYLLKPDMVVTAANDLWAWRYNPAASSTPTLPPFAQECAYTAPVVIRPVISNGDAVDITNILKAASVVAPLQQVGQLNFDDTYIQGTTHQPFNLTLATALCTAAIANSPLGKACAVFPSLNIQGYVDNCVIDQQLGLGNLRFINDAVTALGQACSSIAGSDYSTWVVDPVTGILGPIQNIVNNLCPNSCSGHGVCNMGACTCNAGYTDVDCDHNMNAPASVTGLTPFGCDARDPRGCPNFVTVSGSNFFNGANTVCKFGSIITNITYVSPTQVNCELPANPNPSMSLNYLSIAVSNDGAIFSTDAVNFVWYDSVCDTCKNNGVCSPNPTSCVIGGVCFASATINTGNPCEICNASMSANAWSYFFSNSFSCSPSFDQTQYIATIVDMVAVGGYVATVHAGNTYLSADSAYSLTYSLGPNSNTDYFQIDPVTGIITTKQAIDPNSVNLFTFNSLLVVIAKDKYNNFGTSNLYVQFQGSDLPPVFNQTTYLFNILEGAANGSVVGSVYATDPNPSTGTSVNLGWSIFTYGWILQEANFGGVFNIDPNTGLITVAQPIVYSRKTVYYLFARAIDGGGEYSTANVTISVIHVNHAPTNVTLSSYSLLAEDATDPVGTLSGVDPDVGDTFTYTLVSTGVPFVITGNVLYPTRKLHYQSDPHSFTLSIKVTDQSSLSVTVPVVISLIEVNLPPFNVTLASSASTVSIVGTSIRIPGNFVPQSVFAVSSASDYNQGQMVLCLSFNSSLVEISQNQVVLTAPLDFLATPTFSFMVACADNGSPSLSTSFVTYTVTVLEVPAGGEYLTLLQSPNPIPQNATRYTPVGFVSAVAPNSDATTLTFTTALTDHFEIAGVSTCVPYGTTGAKKCQAQLVVRGGLSFENSPMDVVHITMTSNKNVASVGTVTVVVSNAPSAPSGMEMSSNNITQGTPNGTPVGELIMIAALQPGPVTYVITMTDSSQGRFKLLSNSRRDATSTGYTLVVADTTRISCLTTPMLNVTFSVTDGLFTESFTVTLIVNPRPITIEMPATSIAQSSPVGFAVASVSLTNLVDYPSTLAAAFTLSGPNSALFSLIGESSGITASLALIQSLAGFTAPNLTFTVSISFTGATVAPIQHTYTLQVTATHQPPTFGAYDPFIVLYDAAANTIVGTVTATDPSGSPITYALVSSIADLLQIDPVTGTISLIASPSSNSDISYGSHNVEVSAFDGIATATVDLNITFVDNCYPLNGEAAPCAPFGVCVDNSQGSYLCICSAGHTGSDCSQIIIVGGGNAVGASTNSNAALGAGIGGALGGALGGLALVALIALVVLARRRAARKAPIGDVDPDGQDVVFNNGFMKSDDTYATYDAPVHNVGADFEPGVSNPMYAWYKPTMSRQECEEYLATQGEGAFVIRDSTFTPGWHMLGVKTGNAIVHERIKLQQDGTYELLPSTGSHQPNFKMLPELVDHYAAVRRAGIPFSLALDNPIYDNHLLQEAPREAIQVEAEYETDAPALPKHEYISVAGADGQYDSV